MKILKKLNLKMLTAILAVSLMGIACDSGKSSVPTGEGGPDVTPDTITETTVISDTATSDQVTNASATEESTVVIEPEANTVLEGSNDTELAAEGGDSTNLEVLLPVVDTTEADRLAAEKLAAEQKAEQERLEAEQKAAQEKLAAEQKAEQERLEAEQLAAAEKKAAEEKLAAEQKAAQEKLEAEQKAELERLAAEQKAAEEKAAAEGSGDTGTATTGTEVAAGTDPDVAINDVATEEVAAVAVADYELDTTAGKWFIETPGQVISDADAKAIRAQIAELRKQIKDIMEKFANKEIKRKDAFAQIKALRAKIAELRAKVGNGGNKIEGVWTAWAYQDLFLKINKGEPGWYRLIVVAKNHGTLPDSYDRFSFNVTNENGDIIGSFTVKASDKVYHRGRIDFKLDQPAGSKLNIVWTNDYYVKDKYDANINIKKVVLKKIKAPKEKAKTNAILQGDQYSSMDGRWFFDKQSAYTFWSGQEIGYKFENMEEGVYEITIQAQNYGTLPLPKDYKEYKLDIESDYDSASMSIDANEKAWKSGTVTMSFPEGATTVYVTWTNDSYTEGKSDANFMMKSIHVKKVKDSNLTAYLLKTKPGNKVFILAAFLMISGVLLGIYMKNRSASSAS